MEGRDELAKLDPEKRLAILEAILFVASSPLKSEEIARACGWPLILVEEDLLILSHTFKSRGLELVCSGGSWRLLTAAKVAPWVERFLKVESRRRLSKAQMETLAVVAYRQPVTRAEIENYRGVRSDRTLSQLEDLNLVRCVGRARIPGHPIQYGTTNDFLRYFSINSLEDLPEISLESEVLKKIKTSENNKVPEIPQKVNLPPSKSLSKLLDKIKRQRG